VAISVKGVHQKKGWLSINNEQIYIAHDNGRLNSALPLKSKVTCNDQSQTVTIGATKIQIPGCGAYERVKEYLN